MSVASLASHEAHEQSLLSTLKIQRDAFARETYPSAAVRINRLDRLHNVILDNKDALLAAVNTDFGNRSDAETLMAEIFPLLDGIAYCRKRLGRWMKPQKRHVPMMLAPAKVSLQAQPLGVVGIVVPWNFPVFLGLSPLTYALAAGNRAMIKTSEFAPATGELMTRMLSEAFSEEEVSVVNGGVDVATAFTQLPFDHLVFTGSTNVGRIVARAAAENLTPVTLELGGKSPAIVHSEFPVAEAAKRIAFGKAINAGQVCVSPDYVLCHRDQVNEFAQAFIGEMKQRYPAVADNPDYTAIINTRQRERLQALVEDAKSKGAQVLTANPSDEQFLSDNRLPMSVLMDVNEDMRVMQEEIFGPLLPIVAYDDVRQALDYVNSKPRPLALYYFDWDQGRADKVLQSTHSGGACVNDTMSHVMADDIPFGGVGPSGSGHYHGKEGFETFSNLRGVVRKGRFNASNFVGAPWDRAMFRSLVSMQWRRFKRRSVSP